MTTAQPPSSSSVADEDLPGLAVQDARRILLLCQTAQKTTEAEIAYGVFLEKILSSLLWATERRAAPGARFHNPGAWFKEARLFLSDLGAKLVHDSSHKEPLAEASPPRWRLTSDEMAYFVKQYDRNWGSPPEEPLGQSVLPPATGCRFSCPPKPGR